MANPIAQKWEKRRGKAVVVEVPVELNPTRLQAAEKFIVTDGGIGRPLDLPMLLLRAFDDYVGLNRPVPLTPLAIEKTK